MTVTPELLNRIKMEYLEMPGLALTRRQASRLWNLAAPVCDRALAELVREEFLSEAAGGAFLRRGSGRLRPATPQL